MKFSESIDNREHTFYADVTPMKPQLTPRERAIDRGPAWTSAILTCVIIALHYGILNCGSLYYPDLMDATGYPISVVSWLVTGQFAVAFCLAPLYNRILEKIPNRIGAVAGTLLTSGGIIAATFTNNFFIFMVPYTIFGGIGLGLTVIPVLGIMAEYFDRYRVLALALAASGSGFGTFIYSKLDAYLIETYTWRMALIGVALIHLNLIPLRMLLRPLESPLAPEPTVLVPDQPDLTVCDVAPAVRLDHPKPDLGASNLFLSLLSVNSTRSGGVAAVGGGAGTNRLRGPLLGSERRTRLTQDVRVVIEFVRATCSPNERDSVTFGPISFLSSPGPGVMEQLESTAKAYFTQTDCGTNSVLIPIMFVLGEQETTSGQILSHSRASGIHESGDIVGSRYELGASTEPGEMTSQVYRQVVLGDSFASSMVAAHERKQLKQSIQEVIQRGQRSISEARQKLLDRGLSVCSQPVTALIDQSDYFTPTTGAINFGSDEKVYVLGYCGPDDATIPEEPEEDGAELRTPNPVENSLTKDSDQRADKLKPLTQSTQMLAHSARSNHPTVASKGRGSIMLGSMSQLSKVDKYGESCYRSRDVFASVISLNTPAQAVELLVSKLDDEAKMEMTPARTSFRKLPSFLLADPLILTFLVSRSLAFVADSIMYAHLNSFSLELGFGSERSAALLSFVGVTAMLGRLGMGFVGQFFERLDIRGVSAICLLLVSGCVALLPVFHSYSAMSASCIIYGMLVSPSFAFAPGITFQIVGPNRYDEGVSYLFQFEAIGFLIGGPIGGLIKEINNRYLDCFMFAAASDFCSGLILTVQTLLSTALWHKLTARCTRSDEDLVEAAEMELDRSECFGNELPSSDGDPASWRHYTSVGSMRAGAT